MELHYDNKNILSDALKAIDENKSFYIVVNGWRKSIIKKTMPMYIKYFYNRHKRNEKTKKIEILKFAPCGILTPTLWGIINHAMLAGIKIEYQDIDNILTVSFQAKGKTE